ncbi:hypothetical protein [Rhodococcus opacus]|uniref:hypothetical protein n=1 Tax=Rhodococcus opacus TaxID=37919 RepID=UPI000ABBB67D|nr:hypothetical protein [Rhodococcus opacus]
MTRSEIHPPQPDLGGAPPVADLLRNGLDGLLRDLHPASPTGGESAQHGAPQRNSQSADESRHDSPRDNSSRGFENVGHDTGNQTHQNNATDHDGRTDTHNVAGAGAGHETSQPAFTQANPVATQPSTLAPTASVSSPTSPAAVQPAAASAAPTA